MEREKNLWPPVLRGLNFSELSEIRVEVMVWTPKTKKLKRGGNVVKRKSDQG